MKSNDLNIDFLGNKRIRIYPIKLNIFQRLVITILFWKPVNIQFKYKKLVVNDKSEFIEFIKEIDEVE